MMFELKKYRRGMFDGTEDWCKTWRKTYLCFQKWHEEFGKLSQGEKNKNEKMKIMRINKKKLETVRSARCSE